MAASQSRYAILWQKLTGASAPRFATVRLSASQFAAPIERPQRAARNGRNGDHRSEQSQLQTTLVAERQFEPHARERVQGL